MLERMNDGFVVLWFMVFVCFYFLKNKKQTEN